MRGRYGSERAEIVVPEVEPFGSGGAHVTAPENWIGTDVKHLHTTDPAHGDE